MHLSSRTQLVDLYVFWFQNKAELIDVKINNNSCLFPFMFELSMELNKTFAEF